MAIDLSFVFPCLNEEQTISVCLQELQQVLSSMNINYEIIVADNGSTDQSVFLAKKLGVKVVSVLQKGYGSALQKGFQTAQGKYVAFADIDGSYPLKFLSQMYHEIQKKDADMVIASRMKGKIEKGAMPFLHHYLGTPVLTWLINRLFHGKLSDCNSGFRIFKRTAYQKWNPHSMGMEFASELLIKALKMHAKIIEIPAGLRPDKRNTKPHLKTWRDGMRHLLFILSEAPKTFELFGFIFLFSSIILELFSVVFGLLQIGPFSIFGVHSKIFFILMMILGIEFWFFSTSMYLFKTNEKPTNLTRYFIQLPEENLFLTNVILLFSILLLGIYFICLWGIHGFHDIFYVTILMDVLYAFILLFLLVTGLMRLHILKRLKV